MSQQLINRSPDLKRLRDDGYEVEVRSQHLLIHSVPYLNHKGEVNQGSLVSEITLAGDITTKPGTHIVHFTGDHPCQKDGTEIPQIKHGSQSTTLAPDITVKHSFSNKPLTGYSNYYEKMTRYVEIISAPASSLNPEVTAKTFKLIVSSADDSVFEYFDTSSSRAEITAISAKLAAHKVGIVGLGGTGAYVLDLIAKTPAKEIHLFDGDAFLQHNAFRSPGAPSAEELEQTPSKVAYFGELYSKMRRNIVAHATYIDNSNVDQLKGLDFVFICVDKGSIRKLIIEALEQLGISFIDVGMGVHITDDKLWGVLRVTTSTEGKRDHVRRRIILSDDDGNNDYVKNIQIADLNSLNAALAVIKWKKLCGFYQDDENEYSSTYSTNMNLLTSDEAAHEEQ